MGPAGELHREQCEYSYLGLCAQSGLEIRQNTRRNINQTTHSEGRKTLMKTLNILTCRARAGSLVYDMTATLSLDVLDFN